MRKPVSKRTRFIWFLWSIFHRIPQSILSFLLLCPNCAKHSITVAKRRTRTAYHDDRSNFEISCIDCFEEHDRYWQERWDEYYRGVL